MQGSDTPFFQALSNLRSDRDFATFKDGLVGRRDAAIEGMAAATDALQMARYQGEYRALAELIDQCSNANDILAKLRANATKR